MRLDETMLVKQLLPEICHFLHTCREGNQHAAELRNSASGVLFSLSCNNFNAVFSRISTRLVYINNVGLLSKINFNFLVFINILNRMTFIWMFVEILCIFLTFYIMFTVLLEILMCRYEYCYKLGEDAFYGKALSLSFLLRIEFRATSTALVWCFKCIYLDSNQVE